MDCLPGNGQLGVGILVCRRVVVAVVVGEIRAGDVQAHAMAREEGVGGGTQADCVFDHLPRLD